MDLLLNNLKGLKLRVGNLNMLEYRIKKELNLIQVDFINNTNIILIKKIVQHHSQCSIFLFHEPSRFRALPHHFNVLTFVIYAFFDWVKLQ